MQRNKLYKILYILLLAVLVGSCDSYLETDEDNRLITEEVIADPSLAEGWLLKAYKGLPTNYNFNIDVASDDATTNNLGLNIVSMNEGGWASDFNPISQWSNAYENILYINTFLEYADDVIWFPSNALKNDAFRDRIKAEAYGLRAWYNFNLLQAHSGRATNGQILGFPIVDKVLTDQDIFELPRNTFAECVTFILQDCNLAIQGLPARYAGDDAVTGTRNLNRISGLAVGLIKSRVALYAASPSYADSGVISWQEAANMAAEVIVQNGGIVTSPNDVTFYLAGDASEQPQDILWSSTIVPNTGQGTGGNGWERANLPPSLFGNGNTNPTQGFVESFGTSDGTPVFESSSYDANNPYVDRDPRLDMYVITNRSTFSGSTVKTAVNSGIDALNSNALATRTGYYIKKFMNPQVSLDPSGNVTGAPHYYTYARMTEAYLNFAEAANEAGGPDADFGGFSSRAVINAIRTRAGITNTAYVDALEGTDDMRDLIHNERRIELAFEGHRFWDIRRWGLTNVIAEDVRGIQISEDETQFTPFTSGARNYRSYQIYGPIPLSEIQKYDIIQNSGW